MTGGSAGIGMATVELLVRLDATVVVLVRNTGKMEGAEREVWKKVENWRAGRGLRGRGDGKIVIVQCDLCSLASVREAGSRVRKDHPDIECLVLNAGVMFPNKVETEDGLDGMMTANHLGHFVLVKELVGNLTKAQDGGR